MTYVVTKLQPEVPEIVLCVIVQLREREIRNFIHGSIRRGPINCWDKQELPSIFIYLGKCLDTENSIGKQVRPPYTYCLQCREYKQPVGFKSSFCLQNDN